MTSSPVLCQLKFGDLFNLDTNVNNKGIGVVLMQERKRITFVSKATSLKSIRICVRERTLESLTCSQIVEALFGGYQVYYQNMPKNAQVSSRLAGAHNGSIERGNEIVGIEL